MLLKSLVPPKCPSEKYDEPFRNLLCCYFVMADWTPQQ